MLRNAASRVMWVGRATVFLVGLAVILAVIFGVASTALGKNGNPFILGKATNTATKVTGLVGKIADTTKAALSVNNTRGGPALELKVGNPTATFPIQPNDVAPMTVNSTKRVDNLNADSLDGMNSTEFAPIAIESWHEVGQTGEPAFQNGWQNLGDSRTATAAFYKDPWGVVHLKGTVKSGTNGTTIFTLPCGYGPDKDQNFAVVSYGANTSNVGILDVAFLTPSCDDGSYRAEVRAAQSSATAFSLNDVTFRAHGS